MSIYNASEEVSTPAAPSTGRDILYPKPDGWYVQNSAGQERKVVITGADGFIPVTQLPSITITSTYTVASETEMLALACQQGDVAVRSDLNKSFILRVEPASTLANWQELLTPTDSVLSVGGYTGAVTAGNLLDALKTVDGAGSGLDADLLDGLRSSAFAPATHVGATGVAHGNATTSEAGFMSSADKARLDGIEGTVASATMTLTNKTINLSSNTLVGTIAQFNTALSDGDFATLAGTETLTNKTISVDNNTISGIAASSFVLSNASGNIDGAAAQKAIPAGVVVGTTDTQTLTNKTISLGSNTVSGTLAQFNAAVIDADLARTDAGNTFIGTQSLQDARFAAVSASLPALSYIDACFHLAKDDTDKGAWRKRKGQSWRSEARSAGKYLGSYATATAAVSAGGVLTDVYYNTTNAWFEEITNTGTPASTITYRAGKEDYPTNALITAETGRVIIWDLDGAVPSMWMVFASNISYTGMLARTDSDSSLTCISACNQVLTVGLRVLSSYGALVAISFLSDTAYRVRQQGLYGVVGTAGYWLGNGIQARNTFSVGGNGGFSDQESFNNFNLKLVGEYINDVAITVLPDAPLDEYGMPVPTIYVATNGGVSRIAHDGTVSSTTASASVNKCAIVGNSILASELGTSNFIAYRDVSLTLPGGGSNRLGSWWGFLGNNNYHVLGVPSATTAYIATNAIGTNLGLTLFRENPAVQDNWIKAYITNTYNTGWMVGDVRRCFLANSKTADRCIKAGTLTEVGSITETTYSGGRSVYSGFSSSNYLQEASHADWNALGTGDFSIIMSGVKWGTASTLKTLLSIGDGASNGSLKLEHLAAGTLRVSIYNAGWTTICTSSVLFTDTAEHVVEVKRYTQNGVANTVAILVDGVVVASAVSTLTISNATGYFRIGEGQDASQPWAGGQVACVRISATAPTAEQSKFIAATENALNGGQACLLSNSGSVSALAYDKDTDTLEVGNGTNIDEFQGLKRINSYAHGTGTLKAITRANGWECYVGTSGGTFKRPERNISAELLEQQPVVKREQQYSFTSSGTTQSLPQGWKARGILWNSTDGTFSTPTQTFDGFIWTLTGLTASKAYQINLEQT